ncbi:MAG: zinc ABC transporter substrate-binding protein [Candidatus Kapabacteria bacterium]|nr:zinc ABC transporter substrate-binding protein [Candidatus Kapabacteria bacterium]
MHGIGATALKTLTCILLCFVAFFQGCIKQRESSSRLKIVVTTGMIEDVVKNIVGKDADVTALMGSGVDPHLYKASANDLERLGTADIIFYNGLHLEGKMAEILEKLARRKQVVAVAGALPEQSLRTVGGTQHDPHIWFNVSYWSRIAQYIGDTLAARDTAHAASYKRNAADYCARLDSLHLWVVGQMESIPQQRRVLITAHDAFGYFGDAYNIEVVGLQGISTVAEFGVSDVTRLAELIYSRSIKAVFIESSVPKRSIEAVVEGVRSRGGNVNIGGQLYSDAMGARSTPEGTYIGMVRANVTTIVSALR